MNRSTGLGQRPTLVSIVVLALLAYVPAFTAAPGRMPADSKLYLYLDPGRFMADAAATFDPLQFAGWVPHQHVAYLWPTGPWFWIFDALGVPDWIAHRLWIGTVMLLAGLGVRWCSRLLGLTSLAALTAAVVYQLSPYVLPYVSRTSVMLLPWAGLGWIVGMTVLATRRRSWTWPAAIALAVGTVGAVNATALAMIVPGPALWLIHAAWGRLTRWRDAAVVAVRVAALSAGVSLWWVAMLVIQGRHGADVLPYSEALRDVSLTATAPEVWRGLGYWLFYIRDPFTAATSESLRYLTSTASITLSFMVPIACLVGLTFVSWAHRRFAALLVAAGLLLAVGVHPIDDRSPVMRLLTGSGDDGPALALRSSTRALPVAMLGLALGAGALVTACATVRLRWPGFRAELLVAGIIGLIAALNLPALWTGGFVDPHLERDEDPPDAWMAAAAALDELGADSRVLQIPGAEFGAFGWGYTVDQPLPGLTEKPLLTRDLLPLGSPAAMDLVLALDDRIQDGAMEPAALAPVARMLGVDTIWVPRDLDAERFRTASPELVGSLVAGAPGIGPAEHFGDPVEVSLHSVESPGTVVRAGDTTVVVSGSGEGLVDLAAAGLLTGDEVTRYSASLDENALSTALDDATALMVTDSNRDRAHHWRSSQDVLGFTEPGGPEPGVLADVAGDERLPMFDTTDPTTQTVARQRGAVTAAATAYGEPFAYLPEHRPYMAVDGDATTSWQVGEHADPVGETLRLTFHQPVEALALRQLAGPRQITHVSLTRRSADGAQTGPPLRVMLDEHSQSSDGQRVAVHATSGDVIDLTVEAVAGSPSDPVGFLEVLARETPGTEATVEVVRPPHDALDRVGAATPLAVTLTRWRADPTDGWREDPEQRLIREIDLADARELVPTIAVRVDRRATDAELAGLFGWRVVASSRAIGVPAHAGIAAFDGNPATSWVSAPGEALGATLTIRGVEEPVDRLTISQPAGNYSRIAAVTLRSGDEQREVALDPTTGSATVTPSLPPGDIEVSVSAVQAATTLDRRFGDAIEQPVAIAELELPGTSAVAPVDESWAAAFCAELVTVDGEPLGITFTVEGDGWLRGEPLESEVCTESLELDAGTHLIEGVDIAAPLTVDRAVLTDRVDPPVAPEGGGPTARLVASTRYDRTVEITDCPDGCWLVVGEGFNEAWEATGPDGRLEGPVLVDGGFNGWWLDGSDTPMTIDVRWTVQWGFSLAAVASLIVALTCVGLIVVAVLARERIDPVVVPHAVLIGGLPPLSIRQAVIVATLWTALSALLIAPAWALLGAVAGGAVVLARRARLPELTALATVIVVGAAVTWLERADSPLPNGMWPSRFERLHEWAMFAVVSVLCGALAADDGAPKRVERTGVTE